MLYCIVWEKRGLTLFIGVLDLNWGEVLDLKGLEYRDDRRKGMEYN